MSDQFVQHYRAEWMSDDQWKCALMLADIFGGFHHVYNPIKPFGYGIETNVHGSLPTFDSDTLTRAVILAHDRIVRFEVRSSGPGMVRLCLWKRHKRDGSMFERHPTMEQALAAYRGGDQ